MTHKRQPHRINELIIVTLNGHLWRHLHTYPGIYVCFKSMRSDPRGRHDNFLGLLPAFVNVKRSGVHMNTQVAQVAQFGVKMTPEVFQSETLL